jgi:hypothetical protein
VGPRALWHEPTINPVGAAVYMGRYEIAEVEAGNPSQRHPFEPLADGCPGGWYRSPLLASLIPYLRRRVDGGARVPNPLFDGAPWQVQAAAMEIEREQERWHAHAAALIEERRERERKRPRKGPRRGRSR